MRNSLRNWETDPGLRGTLYMIGMVIVALAAGLGGGLRKR